jgi:hypothetical protein
MFRGWSSVSIRVGGLEEAPSFLNGLADASAFRLARGAADDVTTRLRKVTGIVQD